MNNKEVEKKFKELMDLIHKKTNKQFNEHKEELKKSVNGLIDDAERVVWCVTDKGVAGSGTTYDMLLAIFTGLDNLVTDKKVPKELLRGMFENIGEDEKNEEEDDFFNQIKKFIEREL